VEEEYKGKEERTGGHTEVILVDEATIIVRLCSLLLRPFTLLPGLQEFGFPVNKANESQHKFVEINRK
jgi:hypothetical protein